MTLADICINFQARFYTEFFKLLDVVVADGGKKYVQWPPKMPDENAIFDIRVFYLVYLKIMEMYVFFFQPIDISTIKSNIETENIRISCNFVR